MQGVEPAHAADAAQRAGCETVIWAGGPDAGGGSGPEIRLAGLAFIGGDRLLDPDFLSTAASGRGLVRPLCLRNVSTSTELPARRFIQDYQSEHGGGARAYAVEGWDAAHVILRAVGEGGVTRSVVASRSMP